MIYSLTCITIKYNYFQSLFRLLKVNQLFDPKYCKNSSMSFPTIYTSLESILTFLNQHRDTDQNVNDLLKIYEDVADKKVLPYEGVKHPLIVLEGLDGSGKSTITRKLAKKINGELFCTPPPILHELRGLFDVGMFRSSYYLLGNYIAAIQIAEKLKTNPVILDRFWHSTVAYAIADAVKKDPKNKKLPPQGDSLYLWPSDLLKPDIVLLLSVTEETRISRISRRVDLTTQENEIKADNEFRKNILLAFDNMINPKIIKVNGNKYPNQVIKGILDKMKHLNVVVVD